ncbi:hypothetical protein AXG93_2451s1040 [Marchantia polymorpha subsp. ruderalis]|uniref:Uncharacterized protein n=1 Tax=Marchantia polymorpha subsp. ruderalis TaxID=1480154 RepID=A0A176VEN8_MARPO|nr:hypothetical protein AXG93_2451s1040 [Marchantia polymorpha subsp. ruderalis]
MSKSTPTKTRRLLARHQLNRAQHECCGSGSGMKRRSRVSNTMLLLPVEHERFRSSAVVPSRRLAGSSCRQAAQTPDELQRGETRHSRGRMCRELELKNDALHRHLALSRKVQKVVNQVRDEKLADVQKQFEKQQEKLEPELDSQRAQNHILAEELVRQTRLLEQC